MNRLTMVALGVLALAGCGRGPEQQPLDDNVLEQSNTAPVVENITVPPPVNAANAIEPAAPPPAFSQDEQMRDDADATGLTSRLPDDSVQPGQAANETRPAE